MKYGARNQIKAKVSSVKNGDIMSLIKFDITDPAVMSSVITNESAEDLKLKPGDEVQLIVKAIHVIPVKNRQTSRHFSNTFFLLITIFPYTMMSLNKKNCLGFGFLRHIFVRTPSPTNTL